MYEMSIVPEGHPACGGFSVVQLTLENLYSLFERCTNWWTQSNENLPLCRFLGTKVSFYQSKLIDYCCRYTNYWPGKSNKLTYPSCQPGIITMAKNKIIVPSRQTKPWRKPYKSIFIKPPQQLTTGWYFQQDLCTKPLVTFHTAAISLQEYYTNTEWDNTNITITHLNTQQITNTNFTLSQYPYRMEGTIRMYFYKHTNPDKEVMKDTISNLVPLTNTVHWTNGSSYTEAKLQNYVHDFNTYKSTFTKYTGNPFTSHNLQEQYAWYTSPTNPTDLFTVATLTENTTLESINIPGHNKFMLTKWQEQAVLKSRYNPLRDDGKSTIMYLVPNNKNNTNWEAPTNEDLILSGFPLPINIWGFTDFQKKLNKLQSIDTDHILVFKNTTTNPIRNFPFVILDDDYLHDKSPYQSTVHPDDAKKWYPQLQYQTKSMNTIAQCGYGTPKLPNETSDQVKIKYQFYFKWGGAPAKMVTVDNPLQQPVYPIPRNEQQTTSLQSPASAFETTLYTFDERYNNITGRALERIKKDWLFTETFPSITATSREVPIQETHQAQDQATTSKESEEELQQQLFLHKQQQLELRLRILKLMQAMQM